ncbi:hypothetical protein L6452_18314 [Arctium lappa]|uniref:Uncharacterized protein n=1 Tax=Arctium lappa TaxID=4217 RepID=A0ACB9C5V7_ARCLA|nr:hypothetical protein L6452_18314 [Arctium lappa]
MKKSAKDFESPVIMVPKRVKEWEVDDDKKKLRFSLERKLEQLKVSLSGEVIQNFEVGVGMNMTAVDGRVMPPPKQKLGGSGGKTITTTVAMELDYGESSSFDQSFYNLEPHLKDSMFFV